MLLKQDGVRRAITQDPQFLIDAVKMAASTKR